LQTFTPLNRTRRLRRNVIHHPVDPSHLTHDETCLPWANENLTPRMRNLVAMLWSEWKDLELQIVELNDEVERIASTDAACLRLRQIPGIGPLVATAIVASIGNGAAFHKGREFATWMGLVPKQHSTGGKAKLYDQRRTTEPCRIRTSYSLGLGLPP